ncbi:MAG: hypothetical protein CME64_09680 [Halobacteriovoraceae bacterium]|nr:hypothetical protein [Halobacteriovoraceae bacterium]
MKNWNSPSLDRASNQIQETGRWNSTQMRQQKCLVEVFRTFQSPLMGLFLINPGIVGTTKRRFHDMQKHGVGRFRVFGFTEMQLKNALKFFPISFACYFNKLPKRNFKVFKSSGSLNFSKLFF